MRVRSGTRQRHIKEARGRTTLGDQSQRKGYAQEPRGSTSPVSRDFDVICVEGLSCLRSSVQQWCTSAPPNNSPSRCQPRQLDGATATVATRHECIKIHQCNNGVLVLLQQLAVVNQDNLTELLQQLQHDTSALRFISATMVCWCSFNNSPSSTPTT
ncbi:hypothetical protein J6590_003201 [Homalodisca vitripennis]|nr:hypothetical protein J6590_003201 [Homalodisca vitripennis]